MNTGLVSMRYAKALLRFALKKEDAAQLYQEMQQFLQFYYADTRIAQMLHHPIISNQQKIAVLQTALTLPQQKTSASGIAFIALLLGNKREVLFAQMAHSYIDLYRQHFGIVEAQITTTTRLNSQQTQKIVQFIAQHSQAADVQLRQQIDHSIGGGFVLDFDSYRLDASLRKQLQQLQLLLR